MSRPEEPYSIYQCSNPTCRMRFPAQASSLRFGRCPRCRAEVDIAREILNYPAKGIDAAGKQSPGVEALLDNIRSAWNVGSMFRTADGAGIARLYLCGITPTPLNPQVRKTALGADETVGWKQSNNSLDMALELKNQGAKLIALEDIPGAQNLFELKLETLYEPLVLIVGNEVTGIDPGLLDICQVAVRIPMYGEKQSYNVAVAFGMAAAYIGHCQILSQASINRLPNT